MKHFIQQIYSILKPGLAGAVLLTIFPGLFSGGSVPSLSLVILTVTGTGFLAMSSFAYNQIYEQPLDALMNRTRDRVLPSGKHTIIFMHVLGSTMLAAGLFILGFYVNLLAAGLALLSFLYYVFIYTMILKPSTRHSTVLGGLSGAIGPLVGQAAVLNSLNLFGILMFTLMMLWQPPHFWALAFYLKEDYRRGNVPVLPVVSDIRETTANMIFYQVLLLLFTGLIFWLNMAGLLYTIPSLLLGGIVLAMIFALRKHPTEALARRIFLVTILHVIVWNLVLTADLWLRLKSVI